MLCKRCHREELPANRMYICEVCFPDSREAAAWVTQFGDLSVDPDTVETSGRIAPAAQKEL